MPSKISNGASSTLRRAGRRSASGSGGGGAGAGAGSSMTTPQGNAIPPPSPAQLTQDALELLRQFLMYLDPPSARLLPIDEPPNAEVPIPISDWNVIYSTTQPTNVTSSIKVSSYPSSSKNLFCVQSVLPGVSTRQFWTLMAESGNRRLWDNTVQEGGNWRWLEEELGPNEAPLARSIAARIEYLRMGAIFMVAKPRDMLLLSADVRLPPTADSPLRMVSSCRSEVDPTKPPVKGYTRWDLGVGGFMVEELRGTDAIRVTQLSDLGELASWVPNSVVKMVASTMVPRSLSLISKAALKIQPHEAILGDTAPAGASLRDEIVVKNHERWSRGRGLPGQIGKGPLQARSTAATNDQSLSASTVTAVESTSTAPSSHAQDSVRSSSAFTTTNSSSSSSSPSSSSWKTPVNPNLLAPPLTLQRLSTRLHDLTPPNLSPSSHQARSVVSNDASSRGYGGGSTGGGDGEAASQQSSSRPPSHGSPSMRGHTDEGGNSDVDETVLVSDHQGAGDESMGASQRASFAGTQDDSGEDSLGQLRDARELDERLQRFSLAVRASSTDEAEGSGGQGAAENAVADDEDEVDEARSVLAEALSSSLQSPQLLPKLLPQSPHRRRRSSSANLTAGAASSPPRSSSSASGAMPDPRSPTRRRMEKEASELSAMLLAGSDALVTALAPGARGIEELASSSSGAPSDDEEDTSEVREQALRARSGEGQEQVMLDGLTTTAAAVSPAAKSSALPTAPPPQAKAQPTRIPFKAWDPSFPPSSSSSLVRPSMRRHASSNSSQPIVSTSSAHAMRSFSYSSRSSLAPPEVATASAGETGAAAPVDVGGRQQQQGGGGKRGQRSRPYALALGMMAMLWASSSSAKGQQQRLVTGGGEESSIEAPPHPRQQAPLLVEPGHDAQENAVALQSLEAAKDEPSPAVTAARRALMQRSVSNSSTTSSSSSAHQPPAATAVVAPVTATAALDTPSPFSTLAAALPPLPPTSSSLITPTSTLPRHHTLPPLPLSSPTFGASSWKSTSSKNTMTILPSPPASPRIPGEDDERRRLSRANYRGNWKLLTGDAGGGGEEM